jgi:hypothetical protein
MVQSEKLTIGRAGAALRRILSRLGPRHGLPLCQFGPQILPQTRLYDLRAQWPAGNKALSLQPSGGNHKELWPEPIQ